MVVFFTLAFLSDTIVLSRSDTLGFITFVSETQTIELRVHKKSVCQIICMLLLSSRILIMYLHGDFAQHPIINNSETI